MLRENYKKYSLIFLLLSLSVKVYALDGLSLGVGSGDAGINATRVSAIWSMPKVWCEQCLFKVSGLIEPSVVYLDGETAPLNPEANSNLVAYSLTPVFRLNYREKFFNATPYFEFAIGLAYLSNTEISGMTLGLHGQFEDRIGMGLKFTNYDFNLRCMHFSNGFLGSENHGINVAYANIIYWL